MFKHSLVPNLIGVYKQQYCIPLIGLLMFMVGSQSVHRPTTDSPRYLRYL